MYGIEPEQEIIDIFLNNQFFIYKGTWQYSDACDVDGDGIDDYTIPYNAYQIYDPINDRTYVIQNNLNSEVSGLDIIDIFNNMPKELSKHNKNVYITNINGANDYWFQELYNDPNFELGGMANDTEIYIYRGALTDLDLTKKIIYHETAHNMDSTTTSENYHHISNSSDWAKAVSKDCTVEGTRNWRSNDGIRLTSNYVVTAYESYSNTNAESRYSEDFAVSFEAIALYGSDWFEKEYPHRAEVL